MGFDCGFYKTKRFKDISFKDFKLISEYLDWDNQKPIILKFYPSFKDFWLSYAMRDEKDFPGLPDSEAVEFYRNLPNDGWHFGGEEEIESWCSCGRYIDDYIVNHLNKINEWKFDGINEDFIKNALNWVCEGLEKYGPHPVRDVKAFKEQDDGTTLLIPADGFMITEFDNRMNMVYADEEVGIAYNLDKFWTFVTFRCALKTMQFIDQKEYLVWYERSW